MSHSSHPGWQVCMYLCVCVCVCGVEEEGGGRGSSLFSFHRSNPACSYCFEEVICLHMYIYVSSHLGWQVCVRERGGGWNFFFPHRNNLRKYAPPYIYVNMYTRAQTYTHTYIQTCIHTRTHTHTHTQTQTLTNTHKHTHTHRHTHR